MSPSSSLCARVPITQASTALPLPCQVGKNGPRLALTCHPLGSMAVFMLWDVAEWSLGCPRVLLAESCCAAVGQEATRSSSPMLWWPGTPT